MTTTGRLEDNNACGNKLTFFDLFFLLPRQVPPPFPVGVFFVFFPILSFIAAFYL